MAVVVVISAAAAPAAAQSATAHESDLHHRSPIPGVALPMSFTTGLNNLGQVVGIRDDGMGLLWRGGHAKLLGSLGGGYSFPKDINELGQVVGESSTAEDENHAFIWQRGVMTDLGTLGGPSSTALAINDRGEVVGVSSTADGSSAYFRWRRGTLTRISTPGDLPLFPRAWINNRGQAAGTYLSDGPPPPNRPQLSRIWLWDNGTLTDIGAAGGYDASLHGLNDRGQIVGDDFSPTFVRRIFLWDHGVRTDIATVHEFLGGSDLNNRGQVAFTGFGNRAHLWHRGILIDLGTLAGGADSYVEDINERGDVTGYGSTEAGTRGYIWRQGTMTQLDVLGPDGEMSQGNLLNDHGLVVGVSPTAFEFRGAAWYTRR
jgi:probable HAF family extracellular repeat protein